MSDANNEATTPTPESLLPDLKKELGADCEGVPDESLLMFLYWKPSIERASQRFRGFVKWKTTEGKDLFDKSLRLSKDPELERVIRSEVIIAPPGLMTKAGGPILIGRFRNNDMTDGRTIEGVSRMLYYTVDQLLQRPETQKHGATVVHDLRGFDRSKNARMELAKAVFKGLIGNFPVKINAVYIVQAPFVFIGFFKLVSLFMPAKLKSRIHFIDEFSDLDKVHGVVDPANLLPEMGGTLEWNIGDWVDEQKRAEESGDFRTLSTIE